MINELSDFLRYSLLFDNKAFKPLEHEIEALDNYFSIQKKRFQDKLVVEFNIDQQTKSLPVLSFFMQPFVENAIKFGMKTSEMPLKISIDSKIINGQLVILISNTGKWVEPDKPDEDNLFYTGTGMGLENIYKRMEIAYPGSYEINFHKNEGFVQAEIRMPLDNNY